MSSTKLALLRHKGTPIFRRNPRIFPPAKSKLLRVKQPHIPDPVEFELLNQWWPEYKRQMAAIQDALKYCFTTEKESSTQRVAVEEAFDKDLIAINEKWNEETKILREHFYAKEFNARIADSVGRRKEYDQIEKERIEKLKEKLLTMKMYDKTMVTLENIDARLDEIMAAEPVNYNHAVTERGKPLIPETKSDSSP